LDDFAKAFFGINNGSVVPVTYTFADIVKTLNRIEPYDWAGFLHTRVDLAHAPVPTAGLERGGYRLVYSAEPNALLKDIDAVRKQASFRYSLGCVINEGGVIEEVSWGAPAFNASLTEGMTVLSVNQEAYSAEFMSAAITRAAKDHQPIQLIVRSGDHFEALALPYFDGLRYPHLQRIESVPATLDDILQAKP
jgi:predicted metalloprotease with PDZ domain